MRFRRRMLFGVTSTSSSSLMNSIATSSPIKVALLQQQRVAGIGNLYASEILHLARISPRPILLQFGTKDPFVKNEAATAMAEALTGPKTVKTYEFEHELTYQARVDRIAWLKEQFKIGGK